MRWSVLVVALTGCLKADLVECSDGRLCPSGTTCDIENKTCIDPNGLSVASGDIDLGSVRCGMQSDAVTFPISNFGVSPIDATLSSTVVGVKVSPEVVTIAPRETVLATVSAKGRDESIPGQPTEGTITITTPYEQISRIVRFETVGAIATVRNVDFGEQFSGLSTSRSLEVTNQGNSPFTVSAALGTNPSGVFRLGTVTQTVVQGGQTQMLDVSFVPGAAPDGPYKGRIELAYTGAMCQLPPSTVNLDATSSGELVLVDHTKLDFGSAVCGARSFDIALALSNRAIPSQTVKFQILGPDAAWFSVPDQLTIPGASGGGAISTSAFVSRVQVPLTAKTGTRSALLHIDVDPSGVKKDIQLGAMIAAPSLASDTARIDFSSVGKSGTVVRTARISNTGYLGTVTVSPSVINGPGGTRITISPSSFQIGMDETVPLTFTYVAGTLSGAIPETVVTLSSPGQCSPPPTVVVLGSTTDYQAELPVDQAEAIVTN